MNQPADSLVPDLHGIRDFLRTAKVVDPSRHEEVWDQLEEPLACLYGLHGRAGASFLEFGDDNGCECSRCTAIREIVRDCSPNDAAVGCLMVLACACFETGGRARWAW